MSKFDEALIINKIIYSFQKGNIHSSIEKMKAFIKKNPNNEVAIYNYGYMCDQAKFFDQAVKQYKKVIDINPKNWKAKFNLYINYIKNSKYTEALPLVNDVLKLKKNYQPALRDKGSFFII